MPPKKPLPEEDKAILKKWIHGGAKWGTDPVDRFRYTTKVRAGYDWWSLQPLTKVNPPQFDHPRRIGTELDRFIEQRRRQKGLKKSPPASPRVQVRRLYYDLIGLPPPPEVIQQFAADPSQRAWRALVDRLLAEYEVGRETLEKDVAELLDQLAEAGLIEVLAEESAEP